MKIEVNIKNVEGTKGDKYDLTLSTYKDRIKVDSTKKI